jgi:hypothetical protein
VQLSASAFYAPSQDGRPYDKQSLFQRATKTFSPGTYSMTVSIPTNSTPQKGCFYQTDLTYGIHNVTPVLAYSHGSIPNCGQTQPQPSLECTSLTATEVGTTREYNFRAQATAKNTTISKYVFDYGDGSTATVTTSNAAVNASHTYAQDNQSYAAKVTVYSNNFTSGKTSSGCTTTIKTSPPQAALTCQSLTSASTGQTRTYTFTAKATANNTTINNYVFTITGDGLNDSRTITTTVDSAQLTYTFAKDATNYNVRVAVNGKDQTNVTSDACLAAITTPGGQPPATTVSTPPTLVNTGPGELFAAFSLMTLAGAIGHRYFQQRRKSA